MHDAVLRLDNCTLSGFGSGFGCRNYRKMFKSPSNAPKKVKNLLNTG